MTLSTNFGTDASDNEIINGFVLVKQSRNWTISQKVMI